MIIYRRIKDISDDTPTTVSIMRFEDRGDIVRGWNRVGRMNIKSYVHSPFVNWPVSLPLLSDSIEGERGILFLVNWHHRVHCPATKHKELGNSCLFCHISLTKLYLPHWLRFSWHIPTTPVILNSRLFIYQSFILWSVFTGV